MANDTFATFQQISGLGATDFLVGYRNISETRIGYNDLTTTLASGLSSFSAGTYTTVNANSARQIRLAELAAKKANGELKRGRPVNENSERQARLAKQEINKILGVGQGRPVNPNSARQLRLAELKAKAELNGGAVKRGRPVQVKGDEVAG